MNSLLISQPDGQDGKIASEYTLLSETGRLQTWQRVDLLARMKVNPQLYLTSPYRHVREMAELLAAQLSSEPRPRAVSVDGLKPNRTAHSFERLIDEVRKQGNQRSWTS